MPSWRRKYTPRDMAFMWYRRGLREGLSGYPCPKGPYPEGIPRNMLPTRRAVCERNERAFWKGHRDGLEQRADVTLPEKAIEEPTPDRGW
jgi:hypothetical protein